MYQLCRYTRRSPLDTTPPIRYGDVIHPGDKRLSPETRARFLASGTLAPMELPPLQVLPESWQERTELLATANIFTIGDLLAAKDKELGKAIGKPPKVIRQWKTEAERWLKPEPQSSNSN
jgi:hypothetical protein